MSESTILILTDSSQHAPHEGIYGFVRALARQSGIGDVYICDRNDDDNHHFFRDRIVTEGLHVFLADDWYGYETRHAHMTQWMPASAFDALWLFLDHPVSPEFLTYIEGVFKNRFILNSPSGLIETSAKSILIEMQKDIATLSRHLAPMALCRSVEDVEKFRALHGDTVLKTLRGYGGAGVRRYKEGRTDLDTPLDVLTFLNNNGGQCIAMRYLDNPDQSDKRTIVFDGKIIGSLLRKPAEGSWLCNIASGGTAEISAPNIDEKALIDIIDPWLKAKGIYFYGIDTLKDENGIRLLSEINTLNVGGVKVLEEFTGEDIFGQIVRKFLTLITDYYGVAGEGDMLPDSFRFSELG